MTFLTEALEGVESEGDRDTVPLTQSDQAVFERLWQIDDNYRMHANVVLDHISAMNNAVQECDANGICITKSSLLDDEFGLRSQLEELLAIDTLGDKAHEVWKSSMQKSIEDLLGKLGASGYTDSSGACEVTDPQTISINTGASIVP